jgi:hypothetical protein
MNFIVVHHGILSIVKFHDGISSIVNSNLVNYNRNYEYFINCTQLFQR